MKRMSAIAVFPDELAEFERLLDLADEHPRKAPVHDQLIKLAETLVKRFPEQADAHHMLGLAWYYYPCHASFRSWRCRMALEQATLIEPGHQYSLQYLAYLAFDQERYDEALRLQALLQPGYFLERDQEWRAIKNAETILVCKLRLDTNHFPHADFSAFCSWYFDAEKRVEMHGDFGNHVPPQELREYAEWIFESRAQFPDFRLHRILSFLRAASYLETIRNPALKDYAEQVKDPRQTKD